jgi:hypothetical protein
VPLDPPGEGFDIRFPGAEKNVAALDIALHMRQSELFEQVPQIFHAHVVAADIDAAQKGDISGLFRHCLRLNYTYRRGTVHWAAHSRKRSVLR